MHASILTLFQDFTTNDIIHLKSSIPDSYTISITLFQGENRPFLTLFQDFDYIYTEEALIYLQSSHFYVGGKGVAVHFAAAGYGAQGVLAPQQEANQILLF